MSSNAFNSPEFYTKSLKVRSKLVEKCLRTLAHLIKWKVEGKDSVLDIGCGCGDITLECFYPLLPKNYDRLVCADLSPSMLKSAKETFEGIKNVEFIQLNIEEPLIDSIRRELGTFDHIFSSFCLTYVKDQRQAFQNIYNLLKPGGDILITVQAKTPPIEILIKMAEDGKWKDKLPNIRNIFVYSYREDPHPDRTIKNLLKSIGFQDISIKVEECLETFPNKKFFKGRTTELLKKG